MSLAKELYPDFEPYGYRYYQPIINHFGTVLLQVDDEGHHGDSRILYRDKNDDQRFGLLIFGWGSCSGCDALQACSSLDEIDDLISVTKNDIKWASREELLLYIAEKQWELEFCWHAEETKKFIESAIKILSDQ